jgi:hypothetical protein
MEYLEGVSCTFTEYARGTSGDPLHDRSRFEDVLNSLKSVLVQELKRRDLWNAPPRYLGVFGGNRWDEADLLDELVLDCFEYVFVRRIQGLRNQARVHSNIDGLIVLNVQHFLHDAQRRHDALGYRVFEIARDAVASLLKTGTLHVLAGDPAIRNDTLLGFSPQEDEPAARSPDPSLIRGWNDSLMPDLVMAWHRERVIGELAARIAGLGEEECPAFRFRDLMNPLKEDARSRWLAMVYEGLDLARGSEGPGFEPSPIPISRPRQALEEEQEYQRLLSCVARGIEQARQDERTKDYLRRLLDFLRQWTAALEEGPGAGPPPADSRVGELLQIPRGRIQELKATLGGLANACRERGGIVEAGHSSWSTLKPAHSSAGNSNAEVRLMNLSKRREQLFRLSVELFQAEPEQPAEGLPPVLGDTLIFPDGEPGLEWLLVAHDGSGRAVLVPLDSMPLVGGCDLSLEEAIGEPLAARCGFPIRLTDALLAGGSKARHLAAEVVRQVQEKLDDVELGATTPTLFEREAEADSEYRAWSERLRSSCRRLQGQLQPALRQSPGAARRSPVASSRRARRGFSLAYALAAALLIAVVGLSLQVLRLTQRLHETTVPILIPSRDAGEIRLGNEERGLETRWIVTGEDHALLYLVFRDVPEYPGYAVRLLHPGDAIWWQSRAFSRGEQLLILPVRAEPVRLQLLGLSADGTASILDDRRLIPEAPPATVP